MLFSELHGIEKTKNDDWFDVILDADTQVFVDPFLIFKESTGFWESGHNILVSHFQHAFLLIAQGNLNEDSLPYRKAVGLLQFPEPKELCLGYTAFGTSGAGSGHGFALTIARGIKQAIERGLTDPSHFEELGVLNEGIGADRISDICCTVLKRKLIEYTQKASVTHGVPLAEFELYAAGFDDRRVRFRTQKVALPTNPYTNGPLLLVPQRFLRDLPFLNADDWWNFYENEKLRDDFNYEVLGSVDKKTIINAASANPDLVREWIVEMESENPDPYDFQVDPKGVWQWDQESKIYVRDNPLTLAPASNTKQFSEIIELVIWKFKHFIENERGWDLLWADHKLGKEKPETSAQLLFRGIAKNYCEANNIVIDREVYLGQGPVDFKFSNGYKHRALLEVKKLHNGKFWNGLERQLPNYLDSDEVDLGWFVSIRYRSGRNFDNRESRLPKRTMTLSKELDKDIRFEIIDARPPIAASKL